MAMYVVSMDLASFFDTVSAPLVATAGGLMGIGPKVCRFIRLAYDRTKSSCERRPAAHALYSDGDSDKEVDSLPLVQQSS